MARLGVDEDMECLQDLTGLLELSIEYFEVTDVGLKYLRDLENLKELWLTGTAVSDAGVARLQHALSDCRIEW